MRRPELGPEPTATCFSSVQFTLAGFGSFHPDRERVTGPNSEPLGTLPLPGPDSTGHQFVSSPTCDRSKSDPSLRGSAVTGDSGAMRCSV